MAFDLQIDTGHELVYVTASGRIDYESLVELRNRVREHDNFEPDYDRLLDLRDVQGFDLSTTHAIELGEATDANLSPDSGLAIVAPTDVGYGLARAYQIAAGESSAARVFRTIDEALAWLDWRKGHDPNSSRVERGKAAPKSI